MKPFITVLSQYCTCLVGAVALAEVIADNTRLVRVDLQENDIKTAGLMALSLAMKVNENITRLDVDRETKKESVSYPLNRNEVEISLKYHHCFGGLKMCVIH